MLIAGVDEAGRGPWAGPVVCAAVILDPKITISGLNDSKKLSEKKRDLLAPIIKEKALAWSIIFKSSGYIDKHNILLSTLNGMSEAVDKLLLKPEKVLIDGNKIPVNMSVDAEAIIGGDAIEPAISAASILAKTARDEYMKQLDVKFPGYNFSKHKGYGTKEHHSALILLGPCEEHRMTFAPIKKLLSAF